MNGVHSVQGQARAALEVFLRNILPHCDLGALAQELDRASLAQQLWHEGLALLFRVLFVAKLERPRKTQQCDPLVARESWQEHSIVHCLAPLARKLSKNETGLQASSLEKRLRESFDQFRQHHDWGIFCAANTALLDQLPWGDENVARFLNQLLNEPGTQEAMAQWTPEDLGRVYEGLLGLEPGITTTASCRLRRAALEVVVPLEQGESYRSRRGTGIQWVEEIPAEQFYVRAGLGRKTTGAYYTPAPFVAFLVRQALEPLVELHSPSAAPQPRALLRITVLDPAMGCGLFLVEACRFLGSALYQACCQVWRQGDQRQRLDVLELSREAFVDERKGPNEPEALDEPTSSQGDAPPLALIDCRRLVANHCLYGIDQNDKARDLAAMILDLECFTEGQPLRALDDHLVAGDALTGIFLRHLRRRPRSGRPLDTVFIQGLQSQYDELCRQRELATPGTWANHEASRSLRRVAALWAGVAKEDGSRRRDDELYVAAVKAMIRGEQPPEKDSQRLQLLCQIGSSGIVPELAFPEVFGTVEPQFSDVPVSDDSGHGQGGFHAVLGNPPWDKALPLEREFFASHDVAVLSVPTARERKPLYAKMKSAVPSLAQGWEDYQAPFLWERRLVERAYEWQTAVLTGPGRRRKTGGHGDRYRYFVERGWECLRPGGQLALVLPNALYGTAGATGVRRLLLQEMAWKVCLGFTNTNRIFDIGQGQRFCLIVAEKGASTVGVGVCFGVSETDWLERDDWQDRLLLMESRFLASLSPDYFCFPEVHSQEELDTLRVLAGPGRVPAGELFEQERLNFYQEMNMTTDSRRFTELAKVLGELELPDSTNPRLREALSLQEAGWLVVHEKGTFHSYDDQHKAQPRYLCHARRLNGGPDRAKREAARAACFFRLAGRSTVHASESEKSVFTLLPPGTVVGNSALTESAPYLRPNSRALILLALLNSSCFNCLVDFRMGTNLNQFLLNALPLPRLDSWQELFCAHGALRLVCNHPGFEPLWREQMQDSWRELEAPWNWPAVGTPKERQRVRAALDAVVASAYGLKPHQYEVVLSRLGPHSPLRQAAPLARRALVRLYDDGVEAFVQAEDPYTHIPLVQDLPSA
jgi:hypothetical protein